MSILLDALRKSEAQRQLGSTPTLQSPGGGEVLGDGGNRIWIPATMLLLTAVVIAWIGIAQFAYVEPAADVAVSTPDLNQQTATDSVPASEPMQNGARSAKTPVMDFAAADAAPASHSAPAADVLAEADGRATVEPTKPEPNTDLNARPNADAGRQTHAPRTPEQSPAARANANTPRKTKRKRVMESRQKRSDRLEPYEAQSISYWQIPQSVREGIPELHINVLVYAQNSEDRFLLVNGQRLHEKEELADGLVLEEIQREQAIFSYRDYRFYLKN